MNQSYHGVSIKCLHNFHNLELAIQISISISLVEKVLWKMIITFTNIFLQKGLCFFFSHNHGFVENGYPREV